MWDAASTWPDERCHVRAQDPNPGHHSGVRELNHSATEPAPVFGFLRQAEDEASTLDDEKRRIQFVA